MRNDMTGRIGKISWLADRHDGAAGARAERPVRVHQGGVSSSSGCASG